MTRASGTAMASGEAMLQQVAIRSLPAPARSAAVAASSAAPGVSGPPPTMSTRPRCSLSAASSGRGSAQRSNSAGSTSIGTQPLPSLCLPFEVMG